MQRDGLTSAEVRKRVQQRNVNYVKPAKSDTVTGIFLRNICTIFNLINLILAILIISVHSYKNLLFVVITICNTAIGIFNEWRAKRIIDRMKLVTEQKATVIRNGAETQINNNEIVLDDVLVLDLGGQIVVDCVVLEGNIEVNEAFITGESDNVAKRAGDKLVSGSFVVAGKCLAKVEAVGAQNLIHKVEQSARSIKTSQSKLFVIMNKIVKYISYALIPVGLLLIYARFQVEATTTEIAITSTVAALISMIPEGLVLLTSSVLALATIRLSKKQVLVQDLYSIETLARVDTICLDKTGTLTTGKMLVEKILPVREHTEADVLNILSKILGAIETNNATSKAIEKYLSKQGIKKQILENVEVIPFSSERKYSGIRVDGTEILMGALEFITHDKNLLKELKQNNGDYRLIAVIERKGDKEELYGFAALKDEVRRNAPKIIKFLNDNDVATKIISGDNLTTIEKIARDVEFLDPNGVDLSKLDKINYSELVREFNIFARVTPAQKKELILAIKKQGHTVAMTGDGVNDVLAMREADCSIAIGEGADVARRVARLVLLNSDFQTVPDIIMEGRQTINNLERSATLFLSKTTFATIAAVAFILIPTTYPFSPIEMSLLNFTCIGFPAFVLALETNHERIKNKFVNNIIRYSMPTGFAIVVGVIILSLLSNKFNFSYNELTTMSLFLMFGMDIFLIYRIGRPLNLLRGTLFGAVLGIVAAAFLLPFARNFLGFTFLTQQQLIILGIIFVAMLVVFIFIRWLAILWLRRKNITH